MTDPKKSAQSISEERRLEILDEYGILDTAPEEEFEEIARLAAQICKAPIALITFIDGTRQWNKSRHGLALTEIPLHDSICAKAALNAGFSVFEDIASHPDLLSIPLVQSPPAIRFYASVTLRGKSLRPNSEMIEAPLGTLCVMDTCARPLTAEQRSGLETLGRQVIAQLNLRRAVRETRRERDQSQAALRDSEAFYHLLVESLPQNIFRKDLNGKFTFANSRFCATVGKPLDQVIGRTDFDLFPRDLAKKYQSDDQALLESRQPFETIERNQVPGEGVMHVHVIKTPLYDSSGTVVGVQGIFWDETDAVKAREMLAYERDLLRAMLQNIPDCIYFKDRESRFLACSQSLARKLGVARPDEVLGKTDFDFFHQQHAENAFADEQNILKTGQPMIAKSEHETSKHGVEAWVLSTKVPLTNASGEIIGTFGISKDITAFKETEAQLAVARDAALESARLKSEFLANMSHEIRTPMNAIIGMTGLLLETPLVSEQLDFAETIRDSADGLLNIINDILDFSKIEAGKLEIENIDFELTEVVEGTVEMLAEGAQAKQIEFVSWIHPDVPLCIRADPGRIRQVLINLIGNALKFTDKGEVLITVRKAADSPKGVTLRFEVKDTGIGIREEAQPCIFEAFTQADGSTTRKYGGTGLGLAITRQLVELMGGHIGFESKPGAGSLFWFELPVERAPLSAEPLRDAHARLEGLRVLIVDDNATNRKILQHQLLAWRMRNDAAESGAEALGLLKTAIAQGDPYQIGILDMQMPEMDGIALATEIKGNPLFADVKLVMLTSLGYGLRESASKEAGISAYLVKPVKQSRLFDILATTVGSPSETFQTARRTQIPTPATLLPSRRRLRILLAEDNAVNQKVALRQLQKLGYQAEAVGNGLEVLSAVERITYDVILMDCQMPEMDGYEATRRFRENESTSKTTVSGPGRTYIIAMTANALSGDREKCLNCGMDDYVSKPVRIDHLEAALIRAAVSLQVGSD
jgi:two-component system sensor histidine kinase/response regulator